MSDNALATAAGSALSAAVVWSAERIALAKRAVCPPTATDAEFAFFIEWCKRTGLDPFVKQAFLVSRRAKGPTGEWNERHEPLAAEAGMAAVADSQPDFRGIACATVFAGDEFAVDEQAQSVTHRWNLKDRASGGNSVIGAWALVKREGRTVPVVWLPIETRIQTRKDFKSGREEPTSFWARDPGGMILKCARAAAYRVAFPNIFSGVYLREEMREEDDAPPARAEVTRPPAQALPAPAPKAEASKTAALEQRLAQKAEAPKAEPAPKAPAPRPSPAAQTATTPATALRWGPKRGTPLADATLVELEQAIDLGGERLAKATGKEQWIPLVREGLDALDEEIARRVSAEPPPFIPEPGAEG